MQVTELRFSSNGIYLAHVTSPVFFSYVWYMQEPSAVLVVRYTYARIACDHVVMHCQDGRLLEMHPRYLNKNNFSTYILLNLNLYLLNEV